MISKQPRFLNEVMDAIAILKESKGSPAKKVIERVEKNISKFSNVRNPVSQIQKALFYGVDNGLITQNGGNFKLGLNNKEYQLFKNFKSMSGDGLFREHKGRRRGSRRGRRKGRRRSRRGKRKGRKRSNDIYSAKLGLQSGLVPEDRARRRKRKRSRRGGRRRRHDLKTFSHDDIDVNDPKDAVNLNPNFARSVNNHGAERNETAGRGCCGPSNLADSNKTHSCCGNSGFLCERSEVNRHPPCYNNCQGNCNCQHKMY